MKRLRIRLWRLPSARSRSRLRRGGIELIEMPASASPPRSYSARRVLYSFEPEKPAKEAGTEGKPGRIYVRYIRVIRVGDTVFVTRQVISVSGSAYRDLKKLAEEERDGVIDAMADGLEEPLWEVLADSWETIDLGDFGSLAEAVNALRDTLKSYLIGDPVKFAGSALGLVDLSLLEAIAERVPIPGLDRSLGEIRHYAEIAGIVLVVLAGGHILACASFKLWVHDELGQLLAKLIKTVLRELGAKPVQRPSPAEAEDDWPPPDRPDQTPPHSGPDPNPPDHHNDDQDKDPPNSGPPPASSGGSPVRSYSSADHGQPGTAPPFHPTAGAAPTQPVTDNEIPGSAAPEPQDAAQTRRVLHGQRPARHRQLDLDQTDVIQAGRSARVRAASPEVEQPPRPRGPVSASAERARPAEVREAREVREVDSGRPAGARAAVPRGAAAQWNDLVSRREAEPVRLPRGRVSASAERARPAEVREAREVREVDSGRPAGARAAAPRGAAAQWNDLVSRREAEPVRLPRGRVSASAERARPAEVREVREAREVREVDSGRPAGARAAAPRGAAAQWNDLVSRREAEPVRLPRGRVSASAERARRRSARSARLARSARWTADGPRAPGRRPRGTAGRPAGQSSRCGNRAPRTLRHPDASGARTAELLR